MSDPQAPRLLEGPVIPPTRDQERASRPFLIGETLPKKMHVPDMCRAFRMSPSQFHRHERAGKFERFEVRPQIGHHAWSGVLVDRYLTCEAGASRFVTVGRKAS